VAVSFIGGGNWSTQTISTVHLSNDFLLLQRKNIFQHFCLKILVYAVFIVYMAVTVEFFVPFYQNRLLY